MTDRDFFNRILTSANGDADLGDADGRRLDAFLEATEPVRHLVAAPAEDELSLAWRSELNEKLRAVARPARKSWLSLAWRSATAVTVTAALGMAIFVQTRSGASGELEKGLIELHLDSERSLDMAGVGVAVPEVTAHQTVSLPDDVEFEQVDLDLL